MRRIFKKFLTPSGPTAQLRINAWVSGLIIPVAGIAIVIPKPYGLVFTVLAVGVSLVFNWYAFGFARGYNAASRLHERAAIAGTVQGIQEMLAADDDQIPPQVRQAMQAFVRTGKERLADD